jgi:hypothetical protein
MKEDANQLVLLKSLLHSFADSTGLVVTYHKSTMIQINMNDEGLSHFVAAINYKKGQSTFHLPGITFGWVSITKPSLEYSLPMV